MGYQSGTRLQNYFDIARTSLGYSEDLNFNFQLVLFAQEYDDVPQTITFRRKKERYHSSTHNTLTKASTSVWNNYRDHLDWFWLATHVWACHKTFELFGLTNQKVNRSNFFCDCVKVRTISSRHPESWKNSFSVSLDFGASAATRKKQEKKIRR